MEAKTTKKPSQSKKTQVNRRDRNVGTVHHDLFKLELANMKKNVGLPSRPRLENVEHVHFYHSVDSFGRKQEYCSSIGGHTHKMETFVDENGDLQAKCGPAVRVKESQFKKNTKEEVPFEDNHTHEVVYIDSEQVEVRSRNKHATEEIARIRSAAGVLDMKNV